MPTYASIDPTSPVDGLPYATATPLTTTEADLFNQAITNNADPISVTFGQAIVAIVQLAVTGSPAGNSTYVVMQTELFGDGVWVDVTWIFWNGTQGTGRFVLSAGGVGAINNAFQQARQSGSVPTPQANGSNQMPLGGRVRFVGRSQLSGGSSNSPGVTTGVTATITYKMLGLN